MNELLALLGWLEINEKYLLDRFSHRIIDNPRRRELFNLLLQFRQELTDFKSNKHLYIS